MNLAVSAGWVKKTHLSFMSRNLDAERPLGDKKKIGKEGGGREQLLWGQFVAYKWGRYTGSKFQAYG